MGSILNLITPSLKFEEDYIRIGDSFARIMAICSYPDCIEEAWLSKVANIQGVICSVHMTPLKSEEFIGTILSNKEELEIKLKSGIIINRKKAEKSLENLNHLLENLEKNQEKIFNVYVVLMVISKDKDELNSRTKKVETILASQNMRGITAMYNQEEGFWSIGPYGKCDKKIKNMSKRNMPSLALAAAFPYVSSGIKDKDGFIIGKDKEEEIILVNPWLKDKDRTNSNWTVLGTSGAGKSTFVKRLMLMEWMQGIKQLVVDPQREYKSLCTELGGSWINCGGSSGRINPLQVREMPFEESEGALALHFQTLKIFFSLYLGNEFTLHEQARLEQALEELYFSKGMGWDMKVQDYSNEQYPVMEDLYRLLESKAKEDKEYKNLVNLLRSAAVGADSNILNGFTKAENNSDFIVLDTYDLQESQQGLKRAQYFNIITWCWGIITSNLHQQVSLNIDEAYLIVDKQVPQALEMLKNIAKKIRKYIII